jgi:hypothetical protein
LRREPVEVHKRALSELLAEHFGDVGDGEDV